MEIIGYIIIAVAIGAIIAWLLGKAAGRAAWEKKHGMLQQQFTELEKEFVGYRATQTAQLENIQQQLQSKAGELTASQDSLKESQGQLAETGALLAGARADLRAVNQSVQDKQQEAAALKAELLTIKQELQTTLRQLACQTANNEALQEKLGTQKEEMEGLNKKFNLEFENIANRILETKTEKFTELNKANLNGILEPLGKNISEFKSKVEEVYQKESAQRFSLGERVKELAELNRKISEEANNLTRALKSESKTQGGWGEMILENILERSGLAKGREYFMEYQLYDEQGNALRSDIADKKCGRMR